MRNSLQICRFLSIVIILFLTSNVSLNAGIQHLLPKPQQISEYPEETAVQLQKVNITSPYHLTDFNDWLVNDCGADISSETENVTFLYR